MKKYLIISLIFVVSLILLWFSFFQFRAHLDGFGVVGLNHFAETHISSPFLFSLTTKPYIYFSLTFLPNIIPIIIFFFVGLILAEYFRAWWQMIIFVYVLMLLNLPQLYFDSFVTIDAIRLSVLGILTFLTWCYAFPAWAFLGYYIMLRSRRGRLESQP